MKWTLIRALLRLLSLIPLAWLHVLATPVGQLLSLLPWRKNTIIATNLELCFPELDDRQRRALHRANLVAMTRLALETPAASFWSKPKLLRSIRSVQGWEHVEQARREERSLLFVSGHIGNWELLTLYLSVHLPMVFLYRAPQSSGADRLIRDTRGRFGAELAPSGSPAMRLILRQLASGGGVGLLCDQQPKQGEGVFAPFFGIEALTMTLVNRLVRHTGCQPLFIDCRRQGPGHGFAIHIEPADPALGADDIRLATTTMNQAVETMVRRAPEQYLWIYKRFGLRPPGEPPLYPARRRRVANDGNPT